MLQSAKKKILESIIEKHKTKSLQEGGRLKKTGSRGKKRKSSSKKGSQKGGEVSKRRSSGKKKRSSGKVTKRKSLDKKRRSSGKLVGGKKKKSSLSKPKTRKTKKSSIGGKGKRKRYTKKSERLMYSGDEPLINHLDEDEKEIWEKMRDEEDDEDKENIMLDWVYEKRREKKLDEFDEDGDEKDENGDPIKKKKVVEVDKYGNLVDSTDDDSGSESDDDELAY